VVGNTVARDVATATCGVTPYRIKIGTYKPPPPLPRVVTKRPMLNPINESRIKLKSTLKITPHYLSYLTSLKPEPR
jgi:hypothetical protein